MANIHTSDFDIYHEKVSIDVSSPAPLTPTANSLPSFRVSTTPQPPQLSEKLHSSRHRIRDESRKLLTHLLGQLKTRVLPPPVYNAFTTVKDDLGGKGFALIAETVKGVVKFRAGRQEPDSSTAPLDDETDEDDGRIFSTDATLELMTQLRDVLIISAAQGWQIFDESSVPEAGRRDSNNKSPFRISRNRNSLQPAGRRSRSPSPVPPTTSPELLSQCISIIASVVLEDCRFQTFSPRPSRPPHSLQALTLDVAQREMHVRLLAFFEEGVIRSILEDLRRARGSSTDTGSAAVASHDVEQTPAIVSIKVDQVQDEQSAEPGGPHDWVPWSSPKSTQSLSLHSSNTPSQLQTVYFLAALIPPLLAAVLESVDIVSGNETRVDVAHQFYRLVDLIVTAKPDSYLDIMEVVAYHTRARRSALSAISLLGKPFLSPAISTLPRVHFGCYDYPEGSHVLPYSSDRNIQRVASFRFSPVLGARSNVESRIITKDDHAFGLVNIFTLCLCFVCRKPLWGCTMQGLRFHSASMTIDWSSLRASCNEYYGEILSTTKEQLQTRSHEEISVFSAVLWTQMHIMTNGISSGSIEIMQKGKSAAHAKNHKVDEFELHLVSAWCNSLLLSGTLRLSTAISDYLEQSQQQRPIHGIMYDWSNLVYISSSIKSPYPIPMGVPGASSDLLNVAQHESYADETDTPVAQPFEVVPISHMRDILGYELLIHSDAAARLLLSHIHHLGFFDRLDMEADLFDDGIFNKHTICVFPIPLGLDISTNVETLVATVEACLTDLDLSVNEAGFLLLTRKLWPNGMATEYSLKRLMRIIVTWILAEDDNLAIILRDYLAKQQTLPGVRPPSESLSWPSAQSARLKPASSVNNGGDYVASRRTLLNRFAVKWLLEMHDQDPALYAALIYEICVETSQQGDLGVDILKLLSQEEQKRRDADWSDKLLKYIIRLSQTAGIAFSTFDDLFLRWLNHVSDADVFSQPMPSLYRLFPRETDASQRFSSTPDPSLISEGVGVTPLDPWRAVTDVGSSSKGGFSRSLQWLCAFARSGIDVPVSIFERFSSLAIQFEASLPDSMLLVKALLASSWLKPMGRNQLQNVFASLHSRLLTHILECLATGLQLDIILTFIRQSLGACLLLYGCDRSKTVELNLITEDDINDLPSRRKLNVRGAVVTDPIVIHPDLMNSLEHYLTARVEDVSCLIAKFLNTFLNDSPFLQSYEVDNFVLRNGRMLAQWRLLTPNLSKNCCTNGSSHLVIGKYALPSISKEEIRLVADTFACGLLPAHFETISLCWTESLAIAPIAERVKLVSFLIQLRPYFPGWKVLSWEVIIDTLLEDEYDQKNNEAGPSTAHLSLYGLSSSKDVVGVQSSNTDPDLAILRGSILMLSLQMIADGISINAFALHKIKVYLSKALGFNDITVTPSANGQTYDVRFGDASHIPDASLPCVNELLAVLDAPHSINADLPGLDAPSSSLLVGSTLVDVSLNLFCTGDLLSLPILTLKSMVESLGVIIYKHNFEHRQMKHLQPTLRRAVLRALELMLDDISYEIRQLALSVTQAFIKRWPALTGSIVYTSIEQVGKLIISQSHNSQDALVAQAKSFIETTFTTYASNGFAMNLFKRRLDRDFFLVLKEIMDANAKLTHPPAESLRDMLLRDSLPRATENDHTTFQNVLNNLQTFVEVVHHQGYSPDLMIFVGQQLTPLTRRALELAADDVALETAPLMLIPAILIQHNKANSREMLLCTDTVLRGALHRLDVDMVTLSRLLHVTASLYRKTHPGDNGIPTNPIILVIFEMLSETLRLKTRTLPSTLRAMIENHIWTDIQSENDFYASLAVGKMILQAATYNSSIYGRMSEPAEIGRPSLGKSLTDDAGNVTALTVWNELWPPFEAMINILEADVQMGLSMYSKTTASLTWSTVAELFIFLRCLRTPLALETSSQMATLNRLRSLGAQDSSTGKLSRALKAMSDPPPDIPADILVNQAVKDVVAAEKVRVLETRRDASRATQGR
ncbi:hypothetical protein B0H10DRAFT_1938967 [Mycena sp. CBHHK59/15]|nr:hypothetical protein B0H10DRAFT_1938967 [Mycena sp. CBHHK59/15]